MTRRVVRLDHGRHVIARTLGLTPGQRVVGMDGRQGVPQELWVTVESEVAVGENDHLPTCGDVRAANLDRGLNRWGKSQRG